ncbi:hypothetical protein LTR01_004773 [Friedmanniomyces endolithicus]|nr:hypothetical protein LTS09_005187 [Friedmanniomyces endolithicus]KAK0308893.1 hypothetical protein LTR01_004773 [Friedmanniomyces endolithicus]KAK0829906.1 hypothetical protein LTR73_004043 [Friedmanniomyces endolithicus]
MAQAKSVSKRKNKRKVRTEASAKVDAPRTSHDPNTSSDETSTDPPVFTKRTAVTNPEQAFEDFYLRQATKEFANDLNKLRAANDFHGTESIALLVRALRQGTACFGVEERVRVGEACAGPGA